MVLTLLRLALAPGMVLVTMGGGSEHGAAAILVVAFLSNVLNGVIARRFRVATAGLRRLDSAADSVFYLGAAYAAWRLFPDAIAAHITGIALIVGSLVLNHLVETIKFGREASYHARSAKVWGLMLFTALLVLFLTGRPALFPLAIVAGLVSHLENLAITLVLPEWRHNVRSVENAWRIRSTARRRAAVPQR